MIAGIPIGNITVELTHRCHRRCAFCYVDRSSDGQPLCQDELPAADLARRVGQLVEDSGCKRVQLSGGEPLLRDDLLTFVDYVRRCGASVSIITDGAQLDEAKANELAVRGVGPIQPTLLSGRAEKHDALRGEGSFEQATRALAVGAAAGIRMIASMVITRHNWTEAAAVAELSFALGVRTLALSRFCPVGGVSRKASRELMPSHEQVRAAAAAAAPICRVLGMRLSSVITVPACVWSDREHPPMKTGVCSLMGPRTTVTIGPDGSLKTCSMSQRTVGILGEAPWPELAERLWEEELRPCRETVPHGCRDCPSYSTCLGGCRLSALADGGSFTALDPLAPTS